MRDRQRPPPAEPIADESAGDDAAHTIEFEHTDFAHARAALEEPPAGVRVPDRPKPDWSKERRPGDAHDGQLSLQGQQWLSRIPAEIQPTELCARYPRLANQLAEAWSNSALCVQLLDGLLVDHRGERRGFPSRIALELVMLRDHRVGIERRNRS